MLSKYRTGSRGATVITNAQVIAIVSKSSGGRVVKASGAVDLGLIPSRVKPMTLKLVFTASLLDA